MAATILSQIFRQRVLLTKEARSKLKMVVYLKGAPALTVPRRPPEAVEACRKREILFVTVVKEESRHPRRVEARTKR